MINMQPLQDSEVKEEFLRRNNEPSDDEISDDEFVVSKTAKKSVDTQRPSDTSMSMTLVREVLVLQKKLYKVKGENNELDVKLRYMTLDLNNAQLELKQLKILKGKLTLSEKERKRYRISFFLLFILVMTYVCYHLGVYTGQKVHEFFVSDLQ